MSGNSLATVHLWLLATYTPYPLPVLVDAYLIAIKPMFMCLYFTSRHNIITITEQQLRLGSSAVVWIGLMVSLVTSSYSN